MSQELLKVKEQLRNSVSTSSVTKYKIGELHNRTFMTGVSSNEISKETIEFVREFSEEKFVFVVEFESGFLGDLAVKFTNKDKAEKFVDKVSDDGGRLRLRCQQEESWFLYEAE